MEARGARNPSPAFDARALAGRVVPRAAAKPRQRRSPSAGVGAATAVSESLADRPDDTTIPGVLEDSVDPRHRPSVVTTANAVGGADADSLARGP